MSTPRKAPAPTAPVKTRKRVTHVEFVKPVLLITGDPRPVRTLDAVAGVVHHPMQPASPCPDIWLEGNCIVVGVRRFPLGACVESFDLADDE